MQIQFNHVARKYTDYMEMATRALGRKPVNKDFKEEFQVSKECRTSVRFCPNCGAEIYGKWMFTDHVVMVGLQLHPDKYSTYNQTSVERYRSYEAAYDNLLKISNEARLEKKAARYEAADFAELKVCPLCGLPLRNEPGYFAQTHLWFDLGKEFYINKTCLVPASDKNMVKNFEDNNLESIFVYLKKIRQGIEKQSAEDMASQLAKRMDMAVSNSIPIDTTVAIKESSTNLQNYLQQIIRLESNIYALTKRLGILYYQRVETSRDAIAAKYEPTECIRKETENAKLEIKTLTEALHKEQAKPILQVCISYPAKPTAPREPSEPFLETPGFFNKKKVLAENEAKTARYNREMEEYRRKWAEYKNAGAVYERQFAECQAEEVRQNEENHKRRNVAIQKAQDALAVAQLRYDELKNTEDDRIAEAVALPVPADAAVEMLDKEIAEAEKLLKELFKARNTLYAYNVVFPKYRNIVALSTFCEYLMTGRCATLEGANGAYNLYESECRADMIISQLSVVIESLEQIKQNQYLIYSELQSIRSDLADLNNTMNAALKSIQSIDATTAKISGQMDKISDNTDVIAHNTAVAAYYSKVNAELTNALGFMVAFK